MRLILTPRAEEDIDSACVYLAREADIETAVRFFDSVYASCETLGQSPFAGVEREFHNVSLARIRMWFVSGFDRYLIFYRVTEETVLIVRVLHSARDIEGQLADDEQ